VRVIIRIDVIASRAKQQLVMAYYKPLSSP